MSAKDVRAERQQKLMTTLVMVTKTVDSPDAQARTLQRRQRELATIWLEYGEAHNKAVLREKDETIKKGLEDEYEAKVDDHDAVLNNLEEKIENMEAIQFGPALRIISRQEQLTIADANYTAQLKNGQDRLRTLLEALETMTTPRFSQIESMAKSLVVLRKEVNETMIECKEEVIKLVEDAGVVDLARQHAVSISSLDSIVDQINFALVQKAPEIEAPSRAMDFTNLATAVNATLNSPRESQVNSYKTYAKESIPTFEGQLRQYPAWRKEMKELVLPELQEVHQIRILDKHSPEIVDLQNCVTTIEAWRELDSKFGNSANITTVLVDDFFSTTLKSKTDESKLVELKTIVARLSSDLTAVEQNQVLHNNPYAISHIVKMMPRFWQNKYSENKEKLQNGGKSAWEGIMAFLQNEAFRLETELPWTLDAFAKGDKNASAENPYEKRGKKRVNAIKQEDIKKSPKFDEMTAKYGPCPQSKGHHTFVGRYKELMATDNLRNCEAFINLSTQLKASLVEEACACAHCLSWNHERPDCKKDKRECGVRQCALLHHQLLHGSTVKYVNQLRQMPRQLTGSSEDDGEEEAVKFLHIVSHKFGSKNLSLVILLDDGSDISLITMAAAGYLGLRGIRKLTYLMTAGSSEAVGRMMLHYKFEIPLKNNQTATVSCIGVDTITENSNSRTTIESAYRCFPHVPRGALDRPHDEVAILLGQDQAALLANGGRGLDVVGNLRAMRTELGTGWVLGGWSPRIQGNSVLISSSANLLRQSRLMSRPVRVNVLRTNGEWPDLDEISCQLPRRCTRCKTCQACRHEAQENTAQEQRELVMLKDAFSYDEKLKKCVVTYPMLEDPAVLRNNEWQARAMSLSLEKQLRRKASLETYNVEFQDYIDRGVLVEVTEAEIGNWEKVGGSVNFIAHHGVETPDKATTKTRLVSNPSIRNCGKGPSINAFWPKGPLSLQPMLEVFLRFRAYEVACHYDIRKMYHSVLTTDQEKFLRLLVWRMDGEEWKRYGYKVVAMGDRPAACILELVKDVAATMGEEIDAETAAKIKEDTYVDDGCSGGSKEDVDKMIGDFEELEDGSLLYNGTVQQILSKVSFQLKMMIRSGDNDDRALAKMGGAILGHKWNPLDDEFIFEIKVYLGKKTNAGLHEGPELTRHNLHLLKDFKWTRRTILSTIAGIYDPAGLIAPYVVKFKLYLRDVSLAGIKGWDEELEDDLQIKWKKLAEEMIVSPPISVRRGVRPSGSIGPPDLVVFSDGSLSAYCASIYARQRMKLTKPGPWISGYDEVESWSVSLLLAKARIAPLAGLTPPRSEANGFVLGIRLATLAMRSLRDKPTNIKFILDSECTIAAMESEHGRLACYLANRRGEFLDTMEQWKEEFPHLKVEKLLHTPGPLNISDLGTRDGVTSDLVDRTSEWQAGPSYLRFPTSTWPVKRKSFEAVPIGELKKGKVNSVRRIMNKDEDEDNSLSKIWKTLLSILHYSDDEAKTVGILARVLRYSRKCKEKGPGWHSRSNLLEDLGIPLTPEDLSTARFTMIRLMQPEVEEMLGSKMVGTSRRRRVKDDDEKKTPGSRTYLSTINMASLAPFTQLGISWTQGRFGNQLGKVLGPDKLAILPPGCRLSYLLMVASHQEAHRAGGDTCFRSRGRAWIVKARPLANRVADSCRSCQRRSRVHEEQQMGMLPVERSEVPAKPWSSTAIDLLGPYSVKAMNNARTKLKVWPIVFGCHLTGALHIELSWTYGCDAFMVAYNNFTSIRGAPATVYTDKGTQLTKAAKFIAKEDPASWDWLSVEESTGREGTAWRFCPAASQWRNGMAEQRVRALKDSMDLLVPGGVENLNYAEFASLLNQCANTINDRPIGVRHHKNKTEGEIMPLTPNLLLLGRTSTTLPTKSDVEETNFTRRVSFIKELEESWWNMWFRQVFESLFPLPKWKTRMPNLRTGDICLLGWKTKMGKGNYKLCKVSAVEKDERELVRTVEVVHRPIDSRDAGLPYSSKDLVSKRVAVQNLILICPVEDMLERDAEQNGSDKAMLNS